MDCSKKLDKIDKIVISLTFIILTFCCIFNTFCFASYETIIEPKFLYKCSIIPPGSVNGTEVTIIDGNVYALYEIPVYYGYNYNFIIKQNSTFTDKVIFRLIKFEEEPKIGSNGLVLTSSTVNPGNQAELNYKIDDIKQEKLYLCFSLNGQGANPGLFDIEVTTDFIPNGLSDSINLLVEKVSFSSIWLSIEKIIPFILVVVTFSLGVWFIKHNIIEHSKGRDF